GRIETAGERIEERHGARYFGRVRVMLVPAPGIVRDRPCLPDQARRLFQLRAGNPAGLLDHRGGETTAERGVVIEHRPATDDAARRGKAVFAVEGKILAATVVTACRLIV